MILVTVAVGRNISVVMVHFHNKEALVGLHVAFGIIADSRGYYLVSKRRADVRYAGLWEFPGGKLMSQESPYEALCRELNEEVGLFVQSADPWPCLIDDQVSPRVVLWPFTVQTFSGSAISREGQLVEWVSPAHLSTLAMPPANQSLVQALLLR